MPSATRILLVTAIGWILPVYSVAQPTSPPRDSDMNARFDALAEKFLDEYPALSPVGATSLGDHRFDAELDEVTADDRQREGEFYRRWLDQLAAIDRTQLARDNQVDHALLVRKLERELWELETLREWAWDPIVYTRLAGSSIYGLMAREFAPADQRLNSVTARLEQFPRLYEQIRATLEPERVPAVHAETAIRQNRGVLSTIDNMVWPQMDALSATDRDRLETAIATARRAVEEQQRWLEDELLPNARGAAQLGPELYTQKLSYTLGDGLTRQDVRERAESELPRVRAEMYAIARQVLSARGSKLPLPEEPDREQQQQAIQAALDLAAADVPPRDGIVPAAERSLALTTGFIRDRDLITIPDDPLQIIVMPEFERGVSVAYCDSPGPLEVGQQTFYAVAPLPEDWSDEQCASFLREYNLRSIHNLTVHEAMPGHFVQIAHAHRCPSRLRGLLSSGVFVEGWACYCEQMVSEEGFLADDPLMRLITLKWYLRTIANAILDQSVHFDGIRRADAMRLMTEDAFQEEREAAGKWTRAQVTSAQLSTYFVGFQQHRDMRTAVEEAWGEGFDLKRYHDAVVSHGSPPVRFVRALVLGEPIPE
jgi:uncharacterized protein (DUF885 family)